MSIAYQVGVGSVPDWPTPRLQHQAPTRIRMGSPRLPAAGPPEGREDIGLKTAQLVDDVHGSTI